MWRLKFWEFRAFFSFRHLIATREPSWSFPLYIWCQKIRNAQTNCKYFRKSIQLKLEIDVKLMACISKYFTPNKLTQSVLAYQVFRFLEEKNCFIGLYYKKYSETINLFGFKLIITWILELTTTYLVLNLEVWLTWMSRNTRHTWPWEPSPMKLDVSKLFVAASSSSKENDR